MSRIEAEDTNIMGASNKSGNVIDDPVLFRAMKEPAKWKMKCLECGERVSVQELLEANLQAGFDATDLRHLYCPYHPFSQMVLKPTRSNIKGLLFLLCQGVIRDYSKR